MRFQSWSMCDDSRVGILLRGSSVRECLVVLNQGCCGSSQYNLTDMMLRLDANTTLNKSYLLFITLINNTYQRGDQHLSIYLSIYLSIGSIHSLDSGPCQVLFVPLFPIFILQVVILSCFPCIACIFQARVSCSS